MQKVKYYGAALKMCVCVCVCVYVYKITHLSPAYTLQNTCTVIAIIQRRVC